jgi:hypothetical protein
MDATTTQRQTVTVHLYLHPTKSQTSYLGFMRMPFLDDADQLKPSDVNTTVPPGRLPVGMTVVGTVTRRPGTYSLTIALDAMQAGQATPSRIVQEVPVVVH